MCISLSSFYTNIFFPNLNIYYIRFTFLSPPLSFILLNPWGTPMLCKFLSLIFYIIPKTYRKDFLSLYFTGPWHSPCLILSFSSYYWFWLLIMFILKFFFPPTSFLDSSYFCHLSLFFFCHIHSFLLFFIFIPLLLITVSLSASRFSLRASMLFFNPNIWFLITLYIFLII